VSERRRILLDFDIHPIIDHFTISFAASAFVLSLFVLLFPQVFRQTLTGIVRGLIIVLPFAIISSFLSGLFDGKIRFRRTNTPLLTRKKALGGLFFLFSAAVAVLTFVIGPFEAWVRILDAVFLAGCVVCAVALGRIGKGLNAAMFPG
jgi:O-antigen/teichoic acid export membrane protein